jgi:sugar-specific transcriptional regulator TrmB
MGETILLKPASVETFLEKKESESRQNIEFLRQTLADVERPTEDQRIWNISGCERIFELIQTLISQTKRNVYLLGFGQDIKIFEKALHKAEKRRVKIYGVYCGEEPALMKNLLYHQGQLCSICQEIAISFDSKQAVVGSTYPPESAFAALTANPGIIYIIEQYIKHEIFISELFETYPQPSLEKMKEIYQQVMKKLP